MRKFGSAPVPLWYKDAIIYELHVKAFYDSTSDGIGDFSGLLQKLDYLQDLGVTCLWLLPFFPSPLKDDGYDISDYLNIHPSYGTMEDFNRFLQAAHERNLQVMIELVVNHTSDQHAWFERARYAPPGSPERDFYVWSDTDTKYSDARIIFTDTEKSNWTWDPVAKAYYWHRFFSHQPDLNFDNPAVLEEVIQVMRFWLDLGVDGLRLDAIPYLVERDGTNCENLPETHKVIKAIRAAMDEGYADRVILAEANQWPLDVRPYFGEGDECHMAFHFPLMPRIFMALRIEDRMPITEVMTNTPEIPDNCQWGLFLRNHDELTLEMVTNEERDYMYFAYSADPRMRVNVGIRRRLAPLMDNNRRRIELLNSLLLSFPGTPIIYYGDEIGMGDNIYLGDRNGVRTPMQWSSDRNGGFSRANPARLYSPLVMDPVYGYEAINVEAQADDPSSLLNWTRNMIALRKLFRVFGRGTLQFLEPENRKVLAYVRSYDGEQVLCVANLSRQAQPVQLNVPELEGLVPSEMLGFVEFPVITRQPYPLTLAPYGFFWFELHPPAEHIEVRSTEAAAAAELVLPGTWLELLESRARQILQSQVLPDYIRSQAWSGGNVQTSDLQDLAVLPNGEAAFAFIHVTYDSGASHEFVIPLAMTFGAESDAIRTKLPASVICPVAIEKAAGILHDAYAGDAGCRALLDFMLQGGRLLSAKGSLECKLYEQTGTGDELEATRLSHLDRSRTTVLIGDRFALRFLRRPEPGTNPDEELSIYLAQQTQFTAFAPLVGTIHFVPAEGLSSTIATLHRTPENQGDGWNWTLAALNRYFEDSPTKQAPAEFTPESARDYIGLYLDQAVALGRRTAELHLALSKPFPDEAFAPEPVDAQYLQEVASEVTAAAERALDSLRERLPGLPDERVELAGWVLTRRRDIVHRCQDVASAPVGGLRIRLHGDYHLGETLHVMGDYVIQHFLGETSQPFSYRRRKQSPLKDVASMLQSLSNAVWVAWLNYTSRRSDDVRTMESWAELWESATTQAFLDAYRKTGEIGGLLPADMATDKLVGVFQLRRAFSDLSVSLNQRPEWVQIPLRSIRRLIS
ncbi:MAG: maltose alpha-D-glucosyltransferase [Bryobacteraceae bacterium]